MILVEMHSVQLCVKVFLQLSRYLFDFTEMVFTSCWSRYIQLHLYYIFVMQFNSVW